MKHTFRHRLEAAGAAFGDYRVLLGHRPRMVTQRYMVAEMARLIEAGDAHDNGASPERAARLFDDVLRAFGVTIVESGTTSFRRLRHSMFATTQSRYPTWPKQLPTQSYWRMADLQALPSVRVSESDGLMDRKVGIT